MKSNEKLLNVDMNIKTPLINEIIRRNFWLPEDDGD